jgi:hypothetical protein
MVMHVVRRIMDKSPEQKLLVRFPHKEKTSRRERERRAYQLVSIHCRATGALEIMVIFGVLCRPVVTEEKKRGLWKGKENGIFFSWEMEPRWKNSPGPKYRDPHRES